jgi:hypothetical protein
VTLRQWETGPMRRTRRIVAVTYGLASDPWRRPRYHYELSCGHVQATPVADARRFVACDACGSVSRAAQLC